MHVVLWLLAGSCVGIVNVYSIARTVRSLQPSAYARSIVVTTVSFFMRLAVVALVLGLALQQGIASGLAAFGGMWVARWVVLRYDSIARFASARLLGPELEG